MNLLFAIVRSLYRLFFSAADLRLSRTSAAKVEQAIRYELGPLLLEPGVALHDDPSSRHPRAMDFVSILLKAGASEVRFVRDRGELRLDHRSSQSPGWETVFSDTFSTQSKSLVPGDERCIRWACDLLRNNWSALRAGQPPR